MSFTGYKFKLDLNNKQRSACAGHAGCARFVYNYFLDFCKKEYEENKKTYSAIDMHKILLSELKNKKDSEYAWLKQYSKCSPQQALRNLETAYKNFHRLQSKHGYKKFKYKTVNSKEVNLGLEGLPQFKKKNIKDSFYLEGTIKLDPLNPYKIKLPRIGWLNSFEPFPLGVEIKNVVISKKADDWYIAFKVERENTNLFKIKEFKNDSVGVDLGIKHLATLSNGQKFDNIRAYQTNKKKLRRLQKKLSRQYKKGAERQSNNYKKTKLKIAKLHNKITNIRKDVLHKLTTYLATNFHTVVIEDLKVKNMVKNHNLASAILDGGLFEFKRQLLYKKEKFGGKVILANTFYPSSKLCSCCGTKNDSLKLSERVWVCKSCKTTLDRDLNASLNLEKLKDLAVSSTVTAYGDESSTLDKTKVQLVDEIGIKHQMFTFV